MPTYLKYGKIKGDVKKPPPYRSWIELQSLQWGAGRNISSPTGASASRESSQPNVSEIVVTKVMDEVSSSLLYQEVLMGGNGVVAVIDFVRKDGSVYLRYTMSGTFISGYSISGGGDKPTESLSINFLNVDVKFDPGTPPPKF